MDAAKPKAVFFTGTNGSGKSTMRESMLKDGEFSQDFVHIDPDKIAREINPDDPRSVDMEAGRLAIGQFKQAIAEKYSSSRGITWMQQSPRQCFLLVPMALVNQPCVRAC